MRITSAVPELPPEDVEGLLAGLPEPDDYLVHVKYLRYREKPHLSAWTDFSERSITLQVPEPFFPFGESPYASECGRTIGLASALAAIAHRPMASSRLRS